MSGITPTGTVAIGAAKVGELASKKTTTPLPVLGVLFWTATATRPPLQATLFGEPEVPANVAQLMVAMRPGVTAGREPGAGGTGVSEEMATLMTSSVPGPAGTVAGAGGAGVAGGPALMENSRLVAGSYAAISEPPASNRPVL